MAININLSTIFGLNKKKNRNPLANYCNCNQTKPTGYYVYAHLDNGKPFYIGKGTRRRAWEKSRNGYWDFYTSHMMKQPHEVKILIDGLSSSEAERHEDQIMRDFPDQLINIVDMGRTVDFKKLDEFHNWNNMNKALYKEAYKLEKENVTAALEKYLERYNHILTEDMVYHDPGLIGEVQKQMELKLGKNGPLNFLDRITMCLKKTNRLEEAKLIVEKHFENFKRDLELAKSKAILKRVGLG